ncbi:CRISPR-associated protein, Csx11 family [Thermosyntropha lipolytica DSM 11003]|uniref:CRISPR-associated protein, Csx11 family n=1 Tax=Thermosyntropha lipolytica DSM 11003 TaxID=1123382 RepID=A0A1M5RNI7_9FIRM|nr:CRISPR-associated protein Csx11 [Thermosyntropha lipolytica]SHH27822.1 CRISPR-associated protein, Csx11 family [Thermosyntropha lipolytica DSM 11003]
MTADCLKRLQEHRMPLLKLEIAALMALWDKTKFSSPPNAGCISVNNMENGGLKDLARYFSGHKIKVNGQEFDLWDDFLEDWRDKTDTCLRTIYQHCENYNSGIDKGTPPKDIKVKPDNRKWLGNALGGFKDWIFYVDREENTIRQEMEGIFNDLEEILKQEIWTWENIEDFRTRFKNFTSALLSDDRYPINDITLWDQAYMAASMFKACLAEAVMKDDLNVNLKNYGWRILGVQYDKLGMAERGHKPSHIAWYREKMQVLDKQIKKLLEYDYPAGNEIYRDETGIYFLVGEIWGRDFTDGLAELNPDFNCLKEEIKSIFTREIGGEFYPAVFLSSASRGLMQLGYLLEKAKENFLQVERKKIELEIREKYRGICQICRIRLVEAEEIESGEEKYLCAYCRENKSRKRLAGWLEKRNEETIWMSELRDRNGQVALVTLKFELRDWLNGNMFNTCLVRREEAAKHIRGIKSFIFLLLADCDVENDLGIGRLKEEIKRIGEHIRQEKGEEKKRFIEKKKQLTREKGSLEEIIRIVKTIRQEEGKLTWLDRGLDKNFPDYNIELDEMCKLLIKKSSSLTPQSEGLLRDFIFFPEELAPEAYRGCKKRGETFNDFIRQIFFHSITGTSWETWVKGSILGDRIDWENKCIKWQEFKEENDEALHLLATLLFQFMVRQNPSPARLRRVWDNTRDFFRNIKEKLICYAGIPEQRRKRVVWKNIDNNEYVKILPGSDFKEGEYFDGDIFFYCKDREIYLLSYLPEAKKPEQKIFKLKPYPDGREVGELILPWPLEEAEGDKIVFEDYLPYLSIIEPTPVSWQFVLPAEYVPFLLDAVNEKYQEWFGFVYGKLPLHIGVIVQNYRRPLYVGINALRRIRRDVENTKSLECIVPAAQVKSKIEKALDYIKELGIENKPADYYSLYRIEGREEGEGSYAFYVHPDDQEGQIIRSIKEIDVREKLYIMPNTFDFEFLDANIRRRDIFYEEGINEENSTSRVKRKLFLKDNRPYDIDYLIPKFKKFRQLFGKEKDRSSKLQRLIGFIYEYLESGEEMKELLASACINILNLKHDEELRRGIAEIMEIDTEREDFYSCLLEKMDPPVLKLLVDMFAFWHIALKEV